jgi:hypothetical protein
MLANSAQGTLATAVLWLYYHAVTHLDATGLCDFNDFTSGFVSKVFACAPTYESFILRTHRDSVNFDNDDIPRCLRVWFVDHAPFTFTKHCCNLHKIITNLPTS